MGKSLDLSSPICPKNGLESTISVISQFRQSGLYTHLLCRGWEVGLGQASGRQRKWPELLEPPPVAHVRADPLPAGKSQTQCSDIWEVLGSQGIFRPEADMPGILGVAEPKKLGGQWRVNQKRWPQS